MAKPSKPRGTSKPKGTIASKKSNKAIPSKPSIPSGDTFVNSKYNKKTKPSIAKPKKPVQLDYIDDDTINLPSFEKHHKKNKISQSKVKNKSIQIGDVIQGLYMSKYHPKYKAFPRPTILVLNPNYKGKVHGLALRFLNTTQLKKLKNFIRWGKSNISYRTRTLKRSGSKQDPYKFYHNNLKYFLRNQIRQNIYRTYFVSNLINIKKINFNFDRETKQRQASKSGKFSSDKLTLGQMKKIKKIQIKDKKIINGINTIKQNKKIIQQGRKKDGKVYRLRK